MTALRRAYASAESTPILTVQFAHPGLTGGNLYLAQSYFDISATLEDSTQVTFQRSGIGIDIPDKSTDGRQDILMQIDDVSLSVFNQLEQIIGLNRTTQSKVSCFYRTYVPGAFGAPAGGIYKGTVTQTQVDSSSARLRATFTRIPDMYFPRLRYYATNFPGVKYA